MFEVNNNSFSSFVKMSVHTNGFTLTLARICCNCWWQGREIVKDFTHNV